MISSLRSEVPQKPVSRWRVILFSGLVLLFALASFVMLEGLTEGLSPWVIIGCPGCWAEVAPDYLPALNRWHGAQHGTLIAILFAGSLIGLAWRAVEKPLLHQFYMVGHLVFMASFMAGAIFPSGAKLNNGSVVQFVAVLALLALAYPRPKLLFDFSSPGYSRRLLYLTLAVGALLLYPTIRAYTMQFTHVGIPGEILFFRWGEDATVNLVLITAGLMAATKRPGWKALTYLVGGALLFLGAAAITVPHEAASWGYVGGALSLLAGAAYCWIARTEGRTA